LCGWHWHGRDEGGERMSTLGEARGKSATGLALITTATAAGRMCLYGGGRRNCAPASFAETAPQGLALRHSAVC